MQVETDRMGLASPCKWSQKDNNMAKFITKEIECDVTISDSHYFSVSGTGKEMRTQSFTLTDFLHFLRPADEDAHQMHMAALQSEIASEQQEQETLKEIRNLLNHRHAQKCYEGAVDTSPDVIELRTIFGLIFDSSPSDTRGPVSPPLAKAKGVSETEVLL